MNLSKKKGVHASKVTRRKRLKKGGQKRGGRPWEARRSVEGGGLGEKFLPCGEKQGRRASVISGLQDGGKNWSTGGEVAKETESAKRGANGSDHYHGRGFECGIIEHEGVQPLFRQGRGKNDSWETSFRN